MPQRRFQFTVRALLGVTLVVALPCAWWADKRHRYENHWKRHIQVVDDLEKKGGCVMYGRGEPAQRDAQWVRRLLGDRYFECVVGFCLRGACDDSTLERLSALNDLDIQVLYLENCSVTDRGLGYLKRFPSLEAVLLQGNNFSDIGFSHLQDVSQLSLLIVRTKMLTEGELVEIGQLAGIKELDLMGAQLPTGGMAHLASLKRLEVLGLAETNVRDTDLAHLSALDKLKELDLADTGISGPGLRHLGNLRSLEFLSLVRTNVSDGSLKWFQGVPSLRVVVVGNTMVTEEGAEALRKAAPQLEVQGAGTAPKLSAN